MGLCAYYRPAILVLIAALGTLLCWLAGLVATAHAWSRHFQVNTVRTRAVLSSVFLGRQLLTSAHFRLGGRDLRHVAFQLPHLVAQNAKGTEISGDTSAPELTCQRIQQNASEANFLRSLDRFSVRYAARRSEQVPSGAQRSTTPAKEGSDTL